MKIGLVTPICVTHAMQQEALRCNREFSEATTPYIALLNGIAPDQIALPDGIEAVHVGERFADEQDIWQWCLEKAIAEQWDWCMVVHDDFCWRESGWEEQMRRAESWRLVLASGCAATVWDETATPRDGIAQEGDDGIHIGVVLDSCSFGFRTDIFAERGCVTAARFGYGFGSMDSCAWALEHGYGVLGIITPSTHHWEAGGIWQLNTREILHVPDGGHPQIRDTWRGVVLPARVIDAEHIEAAGHVFSVAPE